MFRLIASNSQSGLRPVLLRKVRSNKNGLLLPGSTTPIDFDIAPRAQLSRNNSSSSSQPLKNADRYFAKAKVDPLFKGAVQNRDPKLNHFEELVVAAEQANPGNDAFLRKRYYETLSEVFKYFKDDSVKETLSRKALELYANLLNSLVFKNRTSRLSGSNNRDSDKYQDSTLNMDVLLKGAILEFADNIINGHFKSSLDISALRILLFAMGQFKAFPEMISLWEAGVNDEEVSKIYLSHGVLAPILPIAYSEKRFTYEQILQIYELNSKGSNQKFQYTLVEAMGKIAIKAGDYSRALDALEHLLKLYESKPPNQLRVLSSLSELHLSFIGSCKDIKIAKHFFDKVIDRDLPYRVVLKVSHVRSLLENCADVNEPFSSLMYFWKVTLKHYTRETRTKQELMNARYATLNNALFSKFFQMFPVLTEESYNKLKELISVYASIMPVDEYLLNTIISNYTWNDRVVFQQLIDNYDVYNVARTPVAYRVALKKLGEIKEFGNEEILKFWNDSMVHLDNEGYRYIPIADWAALRDATIMSSNADTRTEFYLKMLDTYKDFHQDERALQRFAKYWMNKAMQVGDVARVSFGETDFADATEIVVPKFTNLSQNVDYKKTTEPMFAHLRQ